jgi:carbon storage regulator CsrA
MLVLTREINEGITLIVGKEVIEIGCLDIQHKRRHVKVGISASKTVQVIRNELLDTKDGYLVLRDKNDKSGSALMRAASDIRRA